MESTQLFTSAKNKYVFNRTITLVLILCFSILLLKAQNMEYAVVKGGDTIGKITYTKNKTDRNKIIYSAVTNVKTRFIFSISVTSSEVSCFQNGILQYSAVLRKINGSTKANSQTNLSGNIYTVKDIMENELTSINNYPITHSFLSIYYNEPINGDSVYSDRFKNMITIEKTGDHQYTTSMPDGSTNRYYYENGICVKAEVIHSLYKLNFVLTKKEL